MGDIAPQPLPAPITFSIEYGGNITILDDLDDLVDSLGDATVSGNSVTHSTGQPLQATPAGATQLIICHQGRIGQPCQAYRIGRDSIHIKPANGIRVVEGDPIIIDAAPGSIVSALQPPHGPADIHLKQFLFEEAGQGTEVNLERSGTAPDLSYDHFSGKLMPVPGAQVFLYYRDDGFWSEDPENRSDYPGEQDCYDRKNKAGQIQEWRADFSEDVLEGEFESSTFCITTAEGNLGLLFIEPDNSKKPVAYKVYSHIWVR